MTVQFNAQGKIISKRFKMADIQQAMDDQTGFCRACGATRDCCEPDARGYPCDECGRPHSVYGAEEFIFMNLVDA